MAIIPDEHCLSIVIPLTVTGNPPANAANLPIFCPEVPCCIAQPIMTSSTCSGSIPALFTASRIAKPPKVGAVVLL